MELGMSERVRPLVGAVSEFIRERVAPVDGEFLREVETGDRWTLTARQSEILDDLILTGVMASIPWNMLTWRRKPAVPTWQPRPSTAVHRIPAIWKCWSVMQRMRKRSSGLSPCWTAKSVPHLP